MSWVWDNSVDENDDVEIRLPHILVVDDDEIDRMCLERLLLQIFGSELQVDFAVDLEQARRAMDTNAHDIYLVDYHLCSGNGLELIEKAPCIDETRIFILLTGAENRDADIAAARAGVSDFLIKGELTVSRLERSLRYATEAMRNKRLLVQQKHEIREAKSVIEEDVRKHKRLARELKTAQSGLTQALRRVEKSEQEYRWLAQHDSLTKIPNRGLFSQYLQRSLEQALSSRTLTALLLLDVDRFKWVNDTFGHHVGDCLLKQMAERLSQTLGKTECVARLGGDEFAVVADHLADEHAANDVIENIVAAMSEPIVIGGQHIETGISIGGAVFRGTGNPDGDDIMRKADAALYRAKHERRGGFRLFDDDLNEQIVRTAKIKKELPQAIADADFSMVYQPKISLSSGRITGLEALVRWQHQSLGAVPPDEFIPAAEVIGQIIPLSNWIFNDVCKTISEWRHSALQDVPVALNVSAIQLKHPDLVSDFTRMLERHAVHPSQIELEITETAALENLDLAISQLNQLRKIGISVSIDDFGTGYSSLALATSLPADCLKIDRSFVTNVPTSRANAAAVQATISLASCLGICTVAEGVETNEQLVYLSKHGVDHAQGYLFSKPLPQNEILAWSINRHETLWTAA